MTRKDRWPGRSHASAQAAKTAFFAAGNEVDIPEKSPFGRSDALAQAAKTTLFAAGNEVKVSEKSPKAIFPNEVVEVTGK